MTENRMLMLHQRLVSHHSTEELKRKNEKSLRRQSIWTWELLDLAKRKAKESRGLIRWA